MQNNRYVIHCIGHGHIDPTWLWRWTEGYEEVRATFRSALDRMKETSDFVFTASSACFYDWIKRCEPDMFEEIRERVKEGRWDIAGGWWIEPDCNIPGGESFVRHGLYSQRFFDKEFGIQVRVGFNPDSFGHAGTLPQLLKKLGMIGYVYMRPSPPWEMQYPEGATFWWESQDGSRILTSVIPESYCCDTDIKDRISRLPDWSYISPGQYHLMCFYGVGNHGGGPTKKNISAIQSIQQDPNTPEVCFSSLHTYIDALYNETDDLPVISTDLQHHARGCYTVHAEVKALNRSCEQALMKAERYATITGYDKSKPYPAETLETAWKHVLYNQFHDILAGTSIEKSYEDTRDQLGSARSSAHSVLNESIQYLASRIDTTPEGNTIIVFNPLPWNICQVVKVPEIVSRYLGHDIHIVDETGGHVVSQRTESDRIELSDHVFTVEVPGLGYRCYYMRSGVKKPLDMTLLQVNAENLSMENKWWRLSFDRQTGEISSLIDKNKNINILNRGHILACMVDQSDTWSHGIDEWRVEAGRFRATNIQLYEHGDVQSVMRVSSAYKNSTVEAFITLYNDTDIIDITMDINWQEQYTFLKYHWETCIQNGKFFCDTPYGYIERQPNGHEEPCQMWLDVTGTINAMPYGFAMLNDSKYGCDVRKNKIRMSLLRSPAYAYHDPSRHDSSRYKPIMDQGRHKVCFRILPHTGDWRENHIPRLAWEFNAPAFIHNESSHHGDLPASTSFMEYDAPNIIITTLKKKEDGIQLIIRGYESCGYDTKTKIHFNQWNKTISIHFAPHEIKTICIDTSDWSCIETNLLEK